MMSFLLYEVLLISSVCALLPAPENISVNSVNFRHVLKWEPGPGTPLGTEYCVTRREKGKERKRPFKSTNQTSLKLNLHKKKTYILAVQASYNQTRSPLSRTAIFTPFRDTIIGPPELSVAGCGTCLLVNISLPKADSQSGIDDLQRFYDATFRVLLRKDKGNITELERARRSFNISDLEKGVSYCVQVHTKIRANRNTRPSGWHCNFTSPVEPRGGPFILGSVTALSVLVVVLVMALFCLCYTGFLGQLKAPRPRALMMVLLQSSILTPDRTISQKISISSENCKPSNQNNPTASPPATLDSSSEEEYDEEDGDQRNLYLDRDAEYSPYECSQQHPADVYRNGGLAVPEDSGSSVARLQAETEFNPDQGEATGAEIRYSFDQTVVLGRVREEEEEQEEMEEMDIQDISGNVNLFSVIVASLAGRGEDQEEEEEESSRLCESFQAEASHPESLRNQIRR